MTTLDDVTSQPGIFGQSENSFNKKVASRKTTGTQHPSLLTNAEQKSTWYNSTWPDLNTICLYITCVVGLACDATRHTINAPEKALFSPVYIPGGRKPYRHTPRLVWAMTRPRCHPLRKGLIDIAIPNPPRAYQYTTYITVSANMPLIGDRFDPLSDRALH